MKATPNDLRAAIAVRGYVAIEPSVWDKPEGKKPSDAVLVFDTETRTDPGQRLRVGHYQIRKLSDPGYCKSGFFMDPKALTPTEVKTIFSYARTQKMPVHDVDKFIELFFQYCVDKGARCVGFNLPFDLSRLAYHHDPIKRKPMTGGFSFKLTGDPRRPRIQIKHLNARSAFIRFTVPRGRDPEVRNRNKGDDEPRYRGYFVDVRTLAAALTGQSHSLASLAELLKTKHRKTDLEDYGVKVSPKLLKYVVNDVQVTWECFERLQRQYDGFRLKRTQSHEIYGEASIGKAYLHEMCIERWRKLQGDFPPEIIGIIMSAYYGGRSEVRIRREICQVLYSDFLSMYPTVCSLMNLWQFVISPRVDWDWDAADAARRCLQHVSLDRLREPSFWAGLTMLVQVEPDNDLFPVRARYLRDKTLSIGLNYLSADRPLWYTLADCVASTLLTGKAPKVKSALRFTPNQARQEGLRPVNIAGNDRYRVDPNETDFYRRLIELRQDIRQQMDAARKRGDEALRRKLDAEQLAAKITANSTSYGIFVEMNTTHYEKPKRLTCYGPNGYGFPTSVNNVEEPGSYFHPLLATLITGAARLMLAIAEVQLERQGLAWTLMDTDSIAFAKPESMDTTEFYQRADAVRKWFDDLNPYQTEDDLFKWEDENFQLVDGKPNGKMLPLLCYGVSSKRYALMNLRRKNRPVVRRVSAHGLGHLRPPTKDDLASPGVPNPVVKLEDLGVRRWQFDLWYRILKAVLRGSDDVDYGGLRGFENRAVIRYAATTNKLLEWFDDYNRGRRYVDKVKPFNFLLMFQVSKHGLRTAKYPELAAEGFEEVPSVVAPYDRDPAVAAQHCFDRETGKSVPVSILKTYAQALAQYHLHPESKFEHADWLDRGETKRWHVMPTVVEHIGKEANHWEEQLYLGEMPEIQINYGIDPQDVLAVRRFLRAYISIRGNKKHLSKVSNVSRTTIDALEDDEPVALRTLVKLYRAVQIIESEPELT